MNLISLGICVGYLWFAGATAPLQPGHPLKGQRHFKDPAAAESPIQSGSPQDRGMQLRDSQIASMLSNRLEEARGVFDNSALRGTYAFTSSGATSTFIYSLITYWSTYGESRMGTWQFDGAGAFTQNRIAHGSVVQPYDGVMTELKGTYTVDPSGAITFEFAGGLVLNGIVTDGGAGFLFEGRNRLTTPGGTTSHAVESGFARRLN